jgi:hypothetical protein
MEISRIRLGDPTSKIGAVYTGTDQNDITLTLVDIYKSTIQANGVIITPEIEQEIIFKVKNKQADYDRYVDSIGIPEYLKSIFEYSKKSKLIAYCKRIYISEYELFLLAHNCSQIGFTHKSKFTEFVPENCNILDSDISNMKFDNPKQLIKKFDVLLEQRKRFHVHLFEKEKEWHYFYFTYNDLQSGIHNHWEKGSHLHYVGYLWPNLRKRQIWESFDNRNIDIQSIHIRLKPFSFDEKPINISDIESDITELLSRYKVNPE